MTLRPAQLSLLALLSLLPAACGERPNVPQSHLLDETVPQSRVASSPEAPARPLACWIEPDASTPDPFFARDKVLCRVSVQPAFLIPAPAAPSYVGTVDSPKAGVPFELKVVPREDASVEVPYRLVHTFMNYAGESVEVRHEGMIELTRTSGASEPLWAEADYSVMEVDLVVGKEAPDHIRFRNAGTECAQKACSLSGTVLRASTFASEKRRVRLLVPSSVPSARFVVTQACVSEDSEIPVDSPATIEFDCGTGPRTFALGETPSAPPEGTIVDFEVLNGSGVRDAFLDLEITMADGSKEERTITFGASQTATTEWRKPVSGKARGFLQVVLSNGKLREILVPTFTLEKGRATVPLDFDSKVTPLEISASGIDFKYWERVSVELTYEDSSKVTRKTEIVLDEKTQIAVIPLETTFTREMTVTYRVTWRAKTGLSTSDEERRVRVARNGALVI